MSEHGTRARYIHYDCRCLPCKKANSDYAAARYRARSRSNPLVSSDVTRRHLRLLKRSGVGVRVVSDITGIPFQHVSSLRNRKDARVTLRTEQLILGVTIGAYSGGAKVPARKTIRLVKRLRREGFTYHRLAVQFNFWPQTLQRLVKRNKTVTADTEMRVQKFYDRVMAEAA